MVWLVAFVVWFLPEALRTPPQSWSPVTVLVCVALGAFSTAIVVLEIVRGAVPATSVWNDEKHFRVVMFAFGCLLVVQFTGVLLALSSFR
jgi:hypothetical protein